MKREKRILILLLALCMLLSMSGCGARQQSPEDVLEESTPGRDVEKAVGLDKVFSLNSNPRYSFNPMIATNRANQLICDLVYENMVEVDNNFEVIPNVISGWKCNEEGTLWTFTLDTETPHTFSTGEAVTPADLCYSLGMCINADRFRGRFSSYQGASPSGEDEFQVTLGIGDTQFVKLMNVPIIKRGTWDTQDGVRPIGSGPYCYNEENTELHANEYYAGRDQLPVDVIYIKEYTDAASTIAAYEDAYIDVVVNDPSSYTSLGYASSNEIHTYATTNMHYVAFNEESMLGKYSYFRIAMQHAFDRAYLVELLHGNAVAAALPMYPTCSVYPHALEDRLNYDLEACRNILIAAGVQDYDEDGQLEFMSGSPVEIELHFVVCADSSAKCGIARRFQEDMASIGLKVTVHELTWQEYMDALEEGQFKSGKQTVPVDMYYGEVKLRNNFDLTELLQPRDKDNELTNQNYSRSKDTTIVGRIERYLAAPDSTRADEFYQLCDYIMNTQGSLIVIGFEKQQIITRRGVCKGINPNYGNPLYGFEHWEITFDDRDAPPATPVPTAMPATNNNDDKGEKKDD